MHTVASPAISAPHHARDPRLFPRPDSGPEHPGRPEGLDFEWFTGKISDAQHDRFFDQISRINNRVFRSRPAGQPLPHTPGSWSFAVLGDYGSGRPAYRDVVKNVIASPTKLVVTTGDNVYYDASESDWKKKWDPWMPALTRSRPLMPALGDHDIRTGSAAYFRRFPQLGGARYYSFNEGGVHFVSVDTNESLSPGTMQYEWLDRDLASAPAGSWKVIYLHHPVWSSFPSRKNRDNLAPLLARHGVDLLLGGHEHWYSRSKPLPEAGGTVQVVVGTGGESLVPFWYPQEKWNANRQVRWGHLEVEVTPAALVGRFILRNGAVGDTFSIPKRAVSQARSGAALARTAP